MAMPLTLHNFGFQIVISSIFGAFKICWTRNVQSEAIFFFANEMGRKSTKSNFRSSKKGNRLQLNEKLLTEELVEQAVIKNRSKSRKVQSTAVPSKTTSTNFSSTRSLRVRAVQGKIQKLSDAASKHCPWVSTKARAPKGFQHKIVSSCFGPRRVLFHTTFTESNEVKNPALENFQKTTLTPILEEDEAS